MSEKKESKKLMQARCLCEKMEQEVSKKIEILLEGSYDAPPPFVDETRKKTKELKQEIENAYLNHGNEGLDFQKIREKRKEIEESIDHQLELKARFYLDILKKQKVEEFGLSPYNVFGWLVDAVERKKIRLTRLGIQRQELHYFLKPYV
jgi:hypothetical protein